MPRVLVVGNCSADHARIQSLLESRFGAAVAAARTRSDTLVAARGGGFDLVLVNRVLDADGDSGLDLIRVLAARPGAPPAMLISNYPEAQAEAERAGARPGFGKAALNSAMTVQRIADALDQAAEGGASPEAAAPPP